MNDLKLRFSVGQTGQEAGVSAFGYLVGYDYGRFTNNALVGGTVLDGEYVTGMQPKGLPVTNLSWENILLGILALTLNFLIINYQSQQMPLKSYLRHPGRTL